MNQSHRTAPPAVRIARPERGILAVPSGPVERLAPASRPVQAMVKRGFDLVVASAMLVACLPLFAVITALVALDGGAVIYRHQRVGRGLVSFDCLKFRTMMPGAEECLEEYLDHHPDARHEWQAHQKLGFDPRVTPIGRWLRATSLDELPQIVNVLRGEMSLVGPRPVTVGELHHYHRHLSDYAAARPGITGLWQVSGRSDTGFARRVELDSQYVRGRSLGLDIAILLRTLPVVFRREGAR